MAVISKPTTQSAVSQQTAADPTKQVFSEYMANIIRNLPVADELNVVTGPGNAQVSFFFQSAQTDELNANLYNNVLSRRVAAADEKYGVQQVELESSAFASDYLALIQSINFNLSQADQATLQRLVAETANSIKKLRPTWNKWVDVSGKNESPPVPKLDESDTETALMQLTATLQGQWLNPDYQDKLRADPSYPYVHMNEFDQIFNQIPLSVPRDMRDHIKDVYNAQGAQGGLTARRSNATQILNGIRDSIESPSEENGGRRLTGADRMVPGLTFQPDNPTTLVDQLGTTPPTGTVSYAATVTKSSQTELEVKAQAGGGISIPILSFFGVGVGGGAKTSIFEKDFAGSKFSVEVVINNPTLQPQMTVQPLLYNISTHQGWLNSTPVKEALGNVGRTDVTGYVFGSAPPPYDFGEKGDFGIVQALVLSQFMELQLTFEDCTSKDVKKFFEQHASAKVTFLGIPLGGASESSKHSYEYHSETDTKITVVMKPNPPGYTPGATDITQSLCNLVGVGVAYPFA